MGWLSWLFPSPADRIAKARKHIEAERWWRAREELLGLEESAAQALLAKAENAMAQQNLEEAVAWGRAGDDARVRNHLELANRFHHGGLEERFRTVRREIREIRAARAEAERREAEEEQRRLLEVDPAGLSGGPSLLDAPLPEIPGADTQEIAARLALFTEDYPESLQASLPELGTPFAEALLSLEDGRPDRALELLLGLPSDSALVQWELSRCAEALGDRKAAVRSLRSFASAVGGHQRIGGSHSAERLALLLAQDGDVRAGLRVLRDARASEPDVGGLLYPQLLVAVDELPEADQVLADLARRFPRQREIHKLLARVRLKGGERLPAIMALEAAQAEVCDTPGMCGHHPPDPEVLLMLSTLYLEEGGRHQARGLELAREALPLVQGNAAWEAAYLDALVARAEERADAEDLAKTLRQHTPPGTPEAARLESYLPPRALPVVDLSAL